MEKHLFLTGLPSIGKTTALFRIVQSLDKKTAGFHTEEIRRDHRRVGFNLIASGGAAFCVAQRRAGKNFHAGNYVLNRDLLETAVRHAFAGLSPSAIIYADPIGSLYCQSPYFVETVRKLLQSHTLIGTIARRGHALVEEIHLRSDCEILEVTADNRDTIPKIVLDRLNS